MCWRCARTVENVRTTQCGGAHTIKLTTCTQTYTHMFRSSTHSMLHRSGGNWLVGGGCSATDVAAIYFSAAIPTRRKTAPRI